jgi:hypothetical protein
MGLTNPQSADHIAAEAGSFEPQRQNNFSLEIPLGSADKDLIVLSVQSVPLPNESNDEVEIQHQNEKRYVAGQATVDTTSMTIHDYVDRDTRGAVMRWRKQVYDPATGQIGLAKNYKKTAYIIMTAPDGTEERICKLKGCWPQAVTGGNLGHDGSEPVMIEVTLRFDKVLWEIEGAYGGGAG